MIQSFDNRWVVVSGASSGLGRAISIELVAQGARVVLLGRDMDRLAQTAQLAGPLERTHIAALDLAQLEKIAPTLQDLFPRLGSCYGLCHSAGALQLLPLMASKPARARRLMDINFHAGLELARAVTARSVMDAQMGSIVWIASVAAHVGLPGQAAYSATKGAVLAAMRALAIELAPRQIRVNAVSPGWVDTAMTQALHAQITPEQQQQTIQQHPLGLGQAQDVARAAAFMLHPQNRWITAADLVVDGGYSAQ
jgi:NAD(P)-dependent dehydrogenase (short-subunit alcohol dehydrogenase family)